MSDDYEQRDLALWVVRCTAPSGEVLQFDVRARNPETAGIIARGKAAKRWKRFGVITGMEKDRIASVSHLVAPPALRYTPSDGPFPDSPGVENVEVVWPRRHDDVGYEDNDGPITPRSPQPLATVTPEDGE